MVGVDKFYKALDSLDDRIVEVLEKWFEVQAKLRSFCEAQGIPFEDKAHEEIVKSRYFTAKLPQGFSDKLFDMLFFEAKK